MRLLPPCLRACALLLALLSAGVPAGLADPAAPPAYTAIDLGTLGGAFSVGEGLNDRGQVVGQATQAILTADPGFLWQNGTMTALPAFTGDPYSTSNATHITNSGLVIGTSDVNSFSYHGFLYDTDTGVLTDLGTFPGGQNSVVNGINASGQIVGGAQTSGGLFHPFVYSDGRMSDLSGPLGDPAAEVGGINDAGQIVGTYTDGGLRRAFLFSGGQAADLGALSAGGVSQANAINRAGQVVGASDGHAFLYSGGAMTDLGTLPGDTNSTATGINAAGQIIGGSFPTATATSGRAVLWQNGAAFDLSGLIDPNTGCQLQGASGINGSGQISATGSILVGYGTSYKPTHALLLSPVTAQTSTPAVSAIAPSSVTDSSAGFTMTVAGSGFLSGASVHWDGHSGFATTFASATKVTVTFPAAMPVGDHAITVVNPDGAVSNAVTLDFLPSIQSLSPAGTTAGAPNVTLVVFGNGFLFGSTLQIDGQALATVYQLPTQLYATVPAAEPVGRHSVTVLNPDGNVSNALTFTVIPPTLLDHLTVQPAAIAPGQTATGTVFLKGPAPAGGLTVSLGVPPYTGYYPVPVIVPATLLVPAGQTSASFPIADPSSQRTYPHIGPVTVAATDPGGTVTATLTLKPPTVSGTVTLQGWKGTAAPTPQLTLVLTPTGGTSGAALTTTLTPTATGTAGAFTYTLTGVAPGTYTLGVKGPLWLREDVPGGVDTTGGSAAGANVTLPPGDVNGDNVIDSNDTALLRVYFNTVSGRAGFNPGADLNGDGVVDSNDTALLRAHFNAVGQPF